MKATQDDEIEHSDEREGEGREPRIVGGAPPGMYGPAGVRGAGPVQRVDVPDPQDADGGAGPRLEDLGRQGE